MPNNKKNYCKYATTFSRIPLAPETRGIKTRTPEKFNK
jgi:hypothetical protein